MLEEETLEKIQKLQKAIDESEKIVFFGGAGVSTESGIPDFRGAHGLYTENLSAEEIISHDYFMENPEGFYEFYKSHMVFLDAEPNACHWKLAELEAAGKDVTVITQNIDGLHQKAGSKHVIELHGSVHRNRCLNCGKSFDAEYVMAQDGVPHCDRCGGLLKPDVVLYGEALDEDAISGAIEALEEADLLIVGGTSLRVYPAASFVDYFEGTKRFFINLGDNPLSGYTYIDAPIGEVFAEIEVRTK